MGRPVWRRRRRHGSGPAAQLLSLQRCTITLCIFPGLEGVIRRSNKGCGRHTCIVPAGFHGEVVHLGIAAAVIDDTTQSSPSCNTVCASYSRLSDMHKHPCACRHAAAVHGGWPDVCTETVFWDTLVCSEVACTVDLRSSTKAFHWTLLPVAAAN